MSGTLPQIHAALVGLAAVGAVAFGGLILARNPRSTPARLHFVYAVTIAWWFTCMAVIAASGSSAAMGLWSRLLHVSLGMLPGVIYHLNVSLAGLSVQYGSRIRVHWLLSSALTLYALTCPPLFLSPATYAWGMYPRYSGWGLPVIVAYVIVMAEVLMAYRTSLNTNEPRTARHRKAAVFMRGNLFTSIALVDFLPALGIPVYPFGWAVMSVMHAVTLYGSVRYRLIEITPEFAAEHILREMPDGLLVIDTQGIVKLANAPAAGILGCDLDSLTGGSLDPQRHNSHVMRALTLGGSGQPTQEVRFGGRGGSERHIRLSVSTIGDQLGYPVAEVWVLHDVTNERVAEKERARLEESIRDTQKLESLGVMAGGVAHDFNNLLVAILGHAELAETKAGNAAAVGPHLQKIGAAAERASELTQQLLTYAGKRPSHRQPVDLNRLVRDVIDLIGAAISKKADLVLELAEELPGVIGDGSEITQVILNLVTNASESLEDRPGNITLTTGVLVSDNSFRRWDSPGEEREAGRYVFLEVRDTGSGIDAETQERIFDPFFTTKFAGRGLGLATVVGILRTHRGLSRVVSGSGTGTSFTIALPVSEEVGRHSAPPVQLPRSWRGSGIALVVDDEPEVRAVAASMLADAGFQVLEAAHGGEAVETFRARRAEIKVVVLDQTMPELSGREAFKEIRTISNAVPVVFISGYADAMDDPPPGPRTASLHKPFRAAHLFSKVRQAMDG